MKPREYCCCAIPLVNAGIYSTLIVQSATGILVGALAVGTPYSQSITFLLFSSLIKIISPVVGASTPSFASWLLGIVCFVAAAVQPLGFIGVSRVRLHLFWLCFFWNALDRKSPFYIDATLPCMVSLLVLRSPLQALGLSCQQPDIRRHRRNVFRTFSRTPQDRAVRPHCAIYFPGLMLE